jgi:hypothetical protein
VVNQTEFNIEDLSKINESGHASNEIQRNQNYLDNRPGHLEHSELQLIILLIRNIAQNLVGILLWDVPDDGFTLAVDKAVLIGFHAIFRGVRLTLHSSTNNPLPRTHC